jgi:hypothetical protein
LVFETLYFIIYLKRMSASAHFIEKDTGSWNWKCYIALSGELALLERKDVFYDIVWWLLSTELCETDLLLVSLMSWVTATTSIVDDICDFATKYV